MTGFEGQARKLGLTIHGLLWNGRLMRFRLRVWRNELRADGTPEEAARLTGTKKMRVCRVKSASATSLPAAFLC